MEIYRSISKAVNDGNYPRLLEFKQTFKKDIESLNTFFDVFLETKTLDNRKRSKPNWIVYREQLKKYCELCENLRLVDYHLGNYYDRICSNV